MQGKEKHALWHRWTYHYQLIIEYLIMALEVGNIFSILYTKFLWKPVFSDTCNLILQVSFWMRCLPTLWKSTDFSYEMSDELQPVIKLRFSYTFFLVFWPPVDPESIDRVLWVLSWKFWQFWKAYFQFLVI